MPIGRPTDFKESYGEEILQLMAEGLSLAAAAAELGIHRQRVYDWEEKHPDFADTIKLARSKRQLFLERRLLSAKDGPVVTSSIFALKNAAGEDWREKSEHELTGKNGGPIHVKRSHELSDDDLASIAAGSGKGTAQAQEGTE
jgi:transposase